MATKVFNLQRAVADAVRELISCPECRQTLRTPFKQCTRGHNICSQCAEPLQSCPVCEGSFYTENPESTTRLLNALPKLCQYSGNGCPLMFEGEENRIHEVKCEYRSTSCRSPACNAVVPLRDMECHFKEHHKEDYRLWHERHESIAGFDVNSSQEETCKLIICKRSYYWLLFTNNRQEDQLEIRVLAIRNTWTYEFVVKVEIGESDPYVYSYVFRPTLVEALEENQEKKEGFCMKIPFEMIKMIADDNGNVKCTFKGPCGCEGCDIAAGVSPQKDSTKENSSEEDSTKMESW